MDVVPATNAPRLPEDLIRYVAGSTGLPASVAARVVADVVSYFGETVEQYVRRRHTELQERGMKNAQIWDTVADELRQRPVSAADLSERQLRRIVYG